MSSAAQGAIISNSALAQQGKGVPHVDVMELLFFAYRDFTAEADDMLAELKFGRAHHRVLFFVNRLPGIRVADLLELLKITKQSLARVLKQLIEEGYVAQKTGTADRRERLLYPTQKGHDFTVALSLSQSRRIEKALEETGENGARFARAFLTSLIDEDDRALLGQMGLGAKQTDD